MYILGINGGVRLGYQDVSACLVKDGEVLFAIEEERLNRIKFSPGQLPERSIYACLKFAGISIKEIDVIASHGSTWGKTYENILKSYFTDTFGYCPRLEFVHHHDAHAASAYYGSGFKEAMVISFDASGDGVSTQLMIGKKGKLELIERFSRPNSLGIFYSIITQFCGFRRDSDEYKLMGLAAYGDRNAYDMSQILSYENGKFELNEKYLKHIEPGEPQPTRQEVAYSKHLTDWLGKKRHFGEPIKKIHKDIAASAQQQLENTIIHLVEYFQQQTGLRKICLAGGVALNCLANQKIMNMEGIDGIYVQPASSDAGVSIGAAMFVSNKYSKRPKPITSALLGMDYSNEEIKAALTQININYKEIEDPAFTAAKLISENKIIGWFQGRMEFGPRALGARSILANPAMPNVKDLLNEKIKYREEFRPFCPSVIEEDIDVYFTGKQKKSPFMNITYNTTDYAKENIPGIVHADGTARIQTVSKNDNPIYHKLLNYLKDLTGHSVVVNTSFNTNNEPIVASPHDAVATFYRSGIDALIIGTYLIEK
jgi:carbamoyltransferase